MISDHVPTNFFPGVYRPTFQEQGPLVGACRSSEKPMPVWMPKKEIHPLSKRKQYVSERHKQSLREFRQWRKQPERIEIMKMLRLIGKFDRLPVWMKYCKELKAERFCEDATKELIESLVVE